MAEHVYEGAPDGRQSEDVAMPTSRFRPRYRALTTDEKALHDAIKAKATELETLFEAGKDGGPISLARVHGPGILGDVGNQGTHFVAP